MASVTLRKVVKKYGPVEAVKGIDLDIKDHEFMCLLGPSGCGKSSTLRMIAGLEEITAGDIFIGEQRVNDLWPKERDIAMVFENYALYPHMTAYDNMAFPLRSRRVNEGEIRTRISKAAAILDIKNLLGRLPAELSGGQKQRVAIGRAIVRQPSLFLMDEPISHLDAKLRDQMRGELKRLQKDLGATTIYVSHDQIEAMTMADRIAVMNNGEIQQVGTPEEIFNFPVNMFVAYFVGSPSINFIEAQLCQSDGSYKLQWGRYSLNVPPRFYDGLKKMKAVDKVTLGVRPQNISLSSKPEERHVLEGEVFVTQPLGEEMIVEVSLGSQVLIAMTTIDFKCNIGDKVWLHFDENKIHLFRTDTEEAIR